MQLQIYTADINDPHIVEAAFDMFEVEELGLSYDWECITGTCLELGGNAGSFLSESDCLQSCLSTSSLNLHNNGVYPNPTNSNVELVSSYKGIVYVKDALGKVLFAIDKKQDILKLQLKQYSPGIYFIETPEEKYKIIKQ